MMKGVHIPSAGESYTRTFSNDNNYCKCHVFQRYIKKNPRSIQENQLNKYIISVSLLTQNYYGTIGQQMLLFVISAYLNRDSTKNKL